MLNSSDVLVIVPALNEEETIGAVVESVIAAGYPVLVISDGSTDRTAEVAESYGAPVLRLPINLGVGGALRAGFRFAHHHGYQGAVQIDADEQHPVGSIADLISEHNSTGAHFVIGSRFLSDNATLKVGFVRRQVMRALGASASRAARTRITDSTSGFRLITQPLLEQFAASFPSYFLGDTYEAVVSAGRAGYSIREVPAALRPRSVGTSSASSRQATQFTLKSLGLVFLRLHFPIAPFAGTNNVGGRQTSR